MRYDMAGKPLGERAMTPAERMAKWRQKHARRLARKQQHHPYSVTDYSGYHADHIGLLAENARRENGDERS